MAAHDDLHTIVPCHATRARLKARQGSFELSQQLAEKAVALAEETDYLNMQGDALGDPCFRTRSERPPIGGRGGGGRGGRAVREKGEPRRWRAGCGRSSAR